MGVPDGEDRTIDLDREVELRPFRDVTGVHVPADIPGRNDAVEAGGRGRDSDGPGEGPEGYATTRSVHRGSEARIVVPVVQPGLRELIAEQAESRDVPRPAPAGGAERQHAHLQRVARLGAVDVHRTRDRVDAGQVELFQLRRRGGGRELPGRGVERFEMHGLARRDLQRRRKRVVPSVVNVLLVNRVTEQFVHGNSYTATVRAPSITRLVPEMRLAIGLDMNTTPFATSAGVPNLPVGLTVSVDWNRAGMFFSIVCQMPPSK